MTDTKENFNALFSPTGDGLDPSVLEVLESVQRLFSISPQEIFYKWESYCLKMGSEETKLDLDTARMFQKDVQDNFERNAQQGKPMGRASEKKTAVSATPRGVTNGDVFGMLDEITPNVRKGGSIKRKNDFETPAPRKVSRPDTSKASTNGKLDASTKAVPFAQREKSGEVVEMLNDHLPASEAPLAPYSEPRIRPIANSDLKKFSYKPMSMRLSDSSEVLDERLDDFLSLIQKHHNLEDSAFGSAATQSTHEIVAVGRIASDTHEAKLNPASLVLEMSRRMGAGLRVSLDLSDLRSWQFFPGQIVAVRGTNASGIHFKVKEILEVPRLPLSDTSPANIEALTQKLDESGGGPLAIWFTSGPFTTDSDLDFAALEELCSNATSEGIDALILTGPFLDSEHPLVQSGAFEETLPEPVRKALSSDASMTTLFRLLVAPHIQKLCSANPAVTIILVPSTRDVISKHVSWPQENITGKAALGLPKQVKVLPNPCLISLNEMVLGVSSHDVLFELSREQISHNMQGDLLTRLPSMVIEQRYFYPIFPPTRGSKGVLDVGFSKLGEWPSVTPDVLMLPSQLQPSVKV